MGSDDVGLYEPLAELDPAFVAAVRRGRDLELWDAAAIALGEVEPPQTEP